MIVQNKAALEFLPRLLASLGSPGSQTEGGQTLTQSALIWRARGLYMPLLFTFLCFIEGNAEPQEDVPKNLLHTALRVTQVVSAGLDPTPRPHPQLLLLRPEPSSQRHSQLYSDLEPASLPFFPFPSPKLKEPEGSKVVWALQGQTASSWFLSPGKLYKRLEGQGLGVV